MARVNCWDRICVPGADRKDGQSSRFDVETLSQMVTNFVDRGDPIPIDHNHQSNYAAYNGKPAPALGWYGALAVVDGGKIVKLGSVRGVTVDGTEPGIDGRDGLWGFRSSVTPLGEELLPNFKLLSPTFTSEGTRRDGSESGYNLLAVAATNTPWQGGTELTMSRRQPRRPLRDDSEGAQFLLRPDARRRVCAAFALAGETLAEFEAFDRSGRMTEVQALRLAAASGMAVDEIINRNVRWVR